MKIHNQISPYISSVDKITFTNHYSLIYSQHKVYLYQDVFEEENKENLSYLNDIGFSFFLKKINEEESFFLSLIQKTSNSVLDILYDLYQKSSKTVELTKEDISNIYQDLVLQFDQLFQYYFVMQDRIEEMFYPRESYYQLLLHMSDIYHLLSLGRFFLEQWKNIPTHHYREVYTLQNILPNNFISGNVIDATHGKRDLCVYELSNYYHVYYYCDQMVEDVSTFLEQLSLNDCELYLFYVKIALIVVLDGSSLWNVESLLYYVQKTNSFLLEKYQEYQETNNNEFQE